MTIRVLVIDDSATMRRLIANTLQRDPSIELVGEAADPNDARAAIKSLNPDVVTLDIEMPNMNGLDFLERLMRLRPTPVVMVSTLTHAGAPATIRALELGAVDFVAKPAIGSTEGFADLANKVKAAARARIQAPRGRPPGSAGQATCSRFEPNGAVVAIGSSTGGVEALITVLSRFPAKCPPTVITQHMPPSFTASFAERLNRLCAPTVTEAAAGNLLQPGRIYLAPGGSHLEIVGAGAPRCRLSTAEKTNGHRPSVDVLFRSVARVVGAHAVGVILTGMGCDGAEGLLAMRSAGAETVGQNEASSVVYGMPRAAFELGAVAHQLPLERIADRILQLSGKSMTETVQ